MATTTKERMAKRKTPPPKTTAPEAAEKKWKKWIRPAIIFGTFASIILLSVFTQGPNDAWPSWQLILTRIAFLAVSTALYFFMLFRTQSERKKEHQKTKPKKK
jgi:hypothetical protein